MIPLNASVWRLVLLLSIWSVCLSVVCTLGALKTCSLMAIFIDDVLLGTAANVRSRPSKFILESDGQVNCWMSTRPPYSWISKSIFKERCSNRVISMCRLLTNYNYIPIVDGWLARAGRINWERGFGSTKRALQVIYGHCFISSFICNAYTCVLFCGQEAFMPAIKYVRQDIYTEFSTNQRGEEPSACMVIFGTLSVYRRPACSRAPCWRVKLTVGWTDKRACCTHF